MHLKTSPPSPASSSNSSSTPTNRSQEGENEPSLMWHYSHPAILVNIPPAEQRMNLEKIKEFPDWGKERKRGEGKGKFKVVIEDYS